MNTPVIYLLVSIVGALLTVLALFPGPRKGALPSLFFASGMAVGEIAPWHIAWQVLATLAFAAAGAFAAWPGWAGLAVTLASWGGLAVAHVRARRTSTAIEAALAETLGADYRRAFAPEMLAKIGEDRAVRAWQSPFRRRERGVERIRDITYGPAGERNRLDVYRPVDRAERCPTLIYLHGGAWVTGRHDDLQGLPLMLRLASLGWVCVKPGYRLGPQATFPDQLVDVKRALAWVREHGAEYGADPDFVIVTGGSAGGHLSALLALTANRPEYQPGFEHVDTSVTAAVPLYGAYDLLDRNRVRPDTSQMDFLTKARAQVRTRREPRALGGVLSALAGPPGRTTVLRRARSARLAAVLRGRAPLRRGVAQDVATARRPRRAPAHAARLRAAALGSRERRRRRRRPLRRVHPRDPPQLEPGGTTCSRLTTSRPRRTSPRSRWPRAARS